MGFFIHNYNAKTLKVVENKRVGREDAKVKFNKKSIKYNKQSKTYSLEGWSPKGKNSTYNITVTLDGLTGYYKSNPARPYYYDYTRNKDDDKPSVYSYMIADKNKYKPGEAVRFKSYALSSEKQPLTRPLEVWLSGSRVNKRIKTISPYNPGGYSDEIALHDSLGLRLDSHYNITLKDNSGRIIANTHFNYEDYRLTSEKLRINLDKGTHYRNTNNELTITANDANGLLLQDTWADIVVKKNRVTNAYDKVVLLPDTLINIRVMLDNGQVTKFNISDPIFGKVDCAYDIIVKMMTVENKPLEARTSARFLYNDYKFQTSRTNDSVRRD